MAVKTIQIADKPTLDATKALLEDSEVGLAAIKQAASSGVASGSVVGLQIEKYVDEQVNGCVSVSTLPYDFWRGSAVVLNGEIHILGGANGDHKSHYKYNGTSWVSVSTLPYEFYQGSAVVLNGEIHILGSYYKSGSSYPYAKRHYKFNGSSWVSVSTLPYEFYNGSAVVLNGEIHILGGANGDHKSHYKYNGTSWVSVSTLPYYFYGSSAVVYNGEIHILGSSYSYSSGSHQYARYHGKYNGTSWVSVSTLPYDFYEGSAVAYNDEIHILGGASGKTNHYTFNGASWRKTYDVPYEFCQGSAVVYNDEIHILLGLSIHYTVKDDNRHIAAMLPKGAHIMLSDNEDIIYASNAKRISSNIAEVTDTGYVELLAALTEIDDIKGYLTFY